MRSLGTFQKPLFVSEIGGALRRKVFPLYFEAALNVYLGPSCDAVGGGIAPKDGRISEGGITIVRVI